MMPMFAALAAFGQLSSPPSVVVALRWSDDVSTSAFLYSAMYGKGSRSHTVSMSLMRTSNPISVNFTNKLSICH